jgi:hypothetical protein
MNASRIITFSPRAQATALVVGPVIAHASPQTNESPTVIFVDLRKRGLNYPLTHWCAIFGRAVLYGVLLWAFCSLCFAL